MQSKCDVEGVKERKGENECEVREGEQINTEQGEEKKAREINQIKKKMHKMIRK